MAMKPKIKKRWIEALRSGKYAQTKDVLRNEEGFCCLGVLCDVVKEDLGIDWDPREQNDARQFAGDGGVLPVAVRRFVWDGDVLPTCQENPYINLENGRRLQASALNDEMDYTFEEIADAIERDPSL